jgi:hypothetical protein
MSTAETSMVKPSNKIVQNGVPPFVDIMKVEVAANMYPGRLVKKGTNDDDVVVVAAATDKMTGWLGYEQTSKKYRPATVDTIYVIAHQAAVLSGGGFRIVASMANGTAAQIKGTTLIGAAAGEVTVAAAISASWGTSGGTSVLNSTSTPSITMAGSIPPGGRLVAVLMEYCDASGGAADCIVESLI